MEYPNPKDDQAVFNFVARHLLAQGIQAVDHNGDCKYKERDLSCAFGCLIPLSEYTPDFENGKVMSSIERCGSSESSILITAYAIEKGYNLDLISSLQQIHDNSEPENWEECLKGAAISYGFELIPELI